MKSIAAIIAVIAQLTAWLKTYVDKKNIRERNQRIEEINNHPADEFIDKFSGGVRDSDASVLRDQTNTDPGADAKRDRTD